MHCEARSACSRTTIQLPNRASIWHRVECPGFRCRRSGSRARLSPLSVSTNHTPGFHRIILSIWSTRSVSRVIASSHSSSDRMTACSLYPGRLTRKRYLRPPALTRNVAFSRCCIGRSENPPKSYDSSASSARCRRRRSCPLYVSASNGIKNPGSLLSRGNLQGEVH